MNHRLLIVFFLISTSTVYAQTSIDIDSEADNKEIKRHYLPKVVDTKFTYDVYYDRLVEEYKQRMKDNIKKHKALSKELQKPQYSDFSYFGHKRKPKKRPVGKRKFCVECEIVH